MRKFQVLVWFVIFFLQTAKAYEPRQIILSSGWKYHKGDKPEWKMPSFDDSEWQDIETAGGWDYMTPGVDYDGYGWYRISFYLPSEMKEGLTEEDFLNVEIGRVDDNDETYLNGKLIGRNASNAVEGDESEFANLEGFHDKLSNYSLPLNSPVLKWDQVNTLAIRVYDIWLSGGIINPEPRLIVKTSWSDKIRAERVDLKPHIMNPGVSNHVDIRISNLDKERTLKGLLTYDFFVDNSAIPASGGNEVIEIMPGEEYLAGLNYTPLFGKSQYIIFRFIEESTKFSIIKKELLGYSTPGIHVLEEAIKPVVENRVEPGFVPMNPGHTHIEGFLGPKLDLNTEKGLVDFPVQLIEPYITGNVPPWPVGEFLGKLVHGGTKMMMYRDNPELNESMEVIIQTWMNTMREDGYAGTNPRGAEWQGWDIWDHKYVILGLVNYYSVTGYKPALETASRIGDLFVRSFGHEEGQGDLMHMSFHGGLANGSLLEPMVYLYRYTGEKKYLDFCYYILGTYEQENGPRIISELLKGSGEVQNVGNGKGYEMLSCLIGMVQLYKVTGDEDILKAVLVAWNDISKNRLYITGTSTIHELFQPKDSLSAEKENDMGEGCVTAHWIYFSKELFKLSGEQKYLDEIDKSLYNHLLGAQHPVSGDVVYYLALQDAKWYMEPDMYIGPPLCCHTSVKRCISEIPELSFFRHENELGIVLYNESGFHTTINEQDVDIDLDSEYPSAGRIKVKVNPEKPAEFTLNLRVPDWTDSYTAKIGNKKYSGIPGEFLKITRKWKAGDEVIINMNFPILAIEGGASYPGYYALKYGNQVLCVDAAVNGLDNMEGIVFHNDRELNIEKYDGEIAEGWSGNQAFVSNAITGKNGKQLILVPFSEGSQTGGDIRVWIPGKDISL